MQTIIVDMTPGFRMPTIYYSQGDVGTQFAIDLRSRFGDSFPTGTTVTIQATKPSGFGFSVAATSVTNGVATFTATAEMTDEFGRFPAELKVTKTGLTLFSANFYMDGERNTHPEGTTDGSQETVIPELTQLVERVEDAASSVLDMTVVANTLPAGSDATYSYDEETNTATFGIPKGADGSLAPGVLAPTYSSSSTYAVGDYVYYSGSLYRCTTAITTAEAWTSGHWTQVALAPEVSDLKSDINDITDSINSVDVSLEQGAVSTSINKTYDELKTASTTRVRCQSLIPVDPNKTYTISVKRNGTDPSTLQFSIVFYNQNGISTEYNDGGWLSGKYVLPSCHYFSIAIRNSDNSTIIPSNVAAVIAVENNAIFNIEEELSDVSQSASNSAQAINAIASSGLLKPAFVKGVYVWQRDLSTMGWEENAKRVTADLRRLELEQGSVVGITDYSTYSIAFGDNSTEGGWYGGGYNSSDITANDASIFPYVFLVKRNDNADMTDADISAITSQFHSTTSVIDVNFTDASVYDMRSKLGNSLPKPPSNGYVHLSFDDVGYCILNLVNNGASFDSLWDEPFFGMLKRLHDTYGAIFSLYIWDVANLANIPSKFKTELMDSSAWLKFGFHSYTEGSLADTSYNDAKTQYETFINYVFSKIGGVNSVDRMPRLNYFAGNVNALRALRDANCGCIGFLNTDDTRSAYYLTQEELTYLRTHSLWSDRTNGLQFVSTVMRLDWFVSGFSSQYDYNVPVEDNPYDELVYRYGQPAMADLYGGLIVFTHEWQTYSSGYALNSAMVDRIEQVCQFANDYGYDFDYPQNRIPNITSYIVA